MKCTTIQFTNQGVRSGTRLKMVERGRSGVSGSLSTCSRHLTHPGDSHRFTLARFVLVEESVSLTAACPYRSCSLCVRVGAARVDKGWKPQDLTEGQRGTAVRWWNGDDTNYMVAAADERGTRWVRNDEETSAFLELGQWEKTNKTTPWMKSCGNKSPLLLPWHNGI